jgi:SAM-dependent methyltransferase
MTVRFLAAFVIALVGAGGLGSPGDEQSRTDGAYDVEAEFYDAVFSDIVGDVDLIRALAKDTGGPILDLMSGTGRVLLPLARDGHEVWGLDSSEAMMLRARAKLADERDEVKARVHLVTGDARSFTLGLKFPLILIPFGSILHFKEVRDREACLRTVAEHLESDGQFFVAFSNWSRPPSGRLSRIANTGRVLRTALLPRLRKMRPLEVLGLVAGILRIWLFRHPAGELTWVKAIRGGSGEEVLRFDFTTIDSGARTVTKDVLYKTVGRRGAGARHLSRMSLSKIPREEMEDLLDRCGFAVVTLSGGFHGESFKGDSPWQVYLCRGKAATAEAYRSRQYPGLAMHKVN